MKRIFHPPIAPRASRAACLAAIFALGVAACGTLRAQTTYYYTGGSGNWDTTTTDWSTSSTGTPTTAFASSTTSIARIGDVGTAGTLTLQTAINAQELDVDNLTGFIIAGTPALTLATGNITSNFLSGNTASTLSTTISAPLAGTNINVSATGTAGSSATTSVGNDTITLSGSNTFTGNLNLGAAASGIAGAGVNRVNITLAAALPTTATVNFLNTNTAFAVTGGTLALPNNFVLNPNSSTYTPGAFVSDIGATSGNGLTVNGTISGNGDVVFAAGINGGAGPVLLNKVNTYAGATAITNSTTGVIRLGITNALPTTTSLTFGDGSLSSSTKGNTFGALDLSGQNQTVASLATNLAPVAGAVTTAGTANGITNTVGATTSTLTISGSATTNYASIIGIPANVTNLTGASNNIALTLSATNTGTQTLSGANPYTGATTISGGVLVLADTAAPALGGTSGISINKKGTLQMGAATQLNTTTPAPVTLNGAAGTGNAATFSVNGFSQGTTAKNGVGALTLATGSANNVIDFNSKNGVVTFASFVPNSATLTINNYVSNSGTSGGPDELIFNQNESANLGNIVFTGYGASNEAVLGGGFYEVFPTAVPEPTTLLGGALLAGVLGWSQRRRLRGLAGLI